MISQLEKKYNEKVKDSLFKKFNLMSPMQIPRIEKVIINMTAGNQVTNSKIIEEVAFEVEQITGQRPVETRAKRSLASWKLREGMPMGSKVTLRRSNMWYFLDKLINIVIPRIRDFRGVNPKAFDGRGNFSLGIKEQIIFPEIDFDKVKKLKGLDVIVVTSTDSDEQARTLLSELGMPFKKGKVGN